MITIDAPISLLVGAGVAYLARDKDHGGMCCRDTVFQRGYLIQTVILTPLILFFMTRFPDWEWNYMFRAGDFFFGDGQSGLTVLLFAVMVALMNLSYVLGFKIAASWIEAGATKRVPILLGATGALIGAIMLVFLQETLHVGPYDVFQAGDAPLIFTNIEFMLAQGLAGPLLAGGIWWATGPARG